ncbi:hypothetical protein ACFVMC_26230 [Nocardia sp. NPDC127579]|uniref:hypothetical protein n=1 Tax=Nocardia sp. NPDC127579 TaxID=3345402 RepID=UPI0036261CE5
MASLDNPATTAHAKQISADADTESPIVWPDPSPLDSWWEQVMGNKNRPPRRSIA